MAFTDTTINITDPLNTEAVSDGASRIRVLARSVKERLAAAFTDPDVDPPVLKSASLPTTIAGSKITGSIAVTGQITAAEYDAGNGGASKSIDFAQGNNQKLGLNNNTTITLGGGVVGGRYLLLLVQDGSGGWQPTWPGVVNAPTLTTTANTRSLVEFYRASVSGGVYMADLIFTGQ